MKITLLYGGRSAEHEVSILSAFSVLNAIYYNYYQVQLVFITKEGQWVKGPLLTENLPAKMSCIFMGPKWTDRGRLYRKSDQSGRNQRRRSHRFSSFTWAKRGRWNDPRLLRDIEYALCRRRRIDQCMCHG